MSRAPSDPWEVVTHCNEANPSHVARVEHRGRSEWSRRTALAHAADYEARHGRTAIAQRVESGQ